MKLIFALLSIMIFDLSTLFCQSLKPTEKNALIYMLIVDKSEQPLIEEIELVSKATGIQYKATSNSSGIVEILVPKNDTYVLNLEYEKEYDRFDIPNEEFYEMNYKVFYEKKASVDKSIAQINLFIHNSNKLPMANTKAVFIDTKNNHEYYIITDSIGKSNLKVPNNATYTINLANALNYASLTIPNIDHYILNYDLSYDGPDKIYPNLSQGLVNFTYLDLKGNPLPNEDFFIATDTSNELLHLITNSEGKVTTHVPIGQRYYFSVNYFQNFEDYIFPHEPGLYEAEIYLKYISSKDFEKREEKRDIARRLRDSVNYERVTLTPTETLDTIELRILREKFVKERVVKTKAKIEQRAIDVKKKLTEEPDYFVNNKYTVNAILYRLRNEWKDKFIVTDVTCSMNPYMEEVLLWHTMKIMTNEDNQYIFFNDGDGIPISDKIIGATGGLHYTDSESLKDILNIAIYAQSFGCSGDPPENDMEAILEAIKLADKNDEIILIADNLSCVRDYSLITKVNRPIRIILCGVKEIVNEDYLNLAYYSKGSVHTIEEDLYSLHQITDGSELKFLGRTYLLTKGRFVVVLDPSDFGF